MSSSSALAEVEVPPGSLVIGDLHLKDGQASSYEPFLEWLQGVRGAPRLVILGDLFEYWNGAQVKSEGGREILGGLRELVRSGTPVDVIPGNRDFLLDDTFERLSSCRVRHFGLIGTTATGERILFLHGDELATLDRGHRRLHAFLRARPTRWLATHLPFWLTGSVAKGLRRTSKKRTRVKSPEEVALQPEACLQMASTHAAEVVVCGHAHLYREEVLDGGVRWYVVDAFGGPRDTLEIQAAGGIRPRKLEAGSASV